MSPRALIADDEEHLRAALRRRIAEVWPELEIVAEARNGLEALELAGELEPDIAFLDIRMPGLDGLAVAAHLAGRCHLVFVTAYDEYAVAAFEQEAVDYLVKPVTTERLARTVARLQERLRQDALPQPLDTLMQRLGGARPNYLQWVRAARGEVVRVVPVEQVSCFVAADKYVSVYAGGEELLMRKSLRELEAELDPQRFWRVHRGAIVNLGFVEAARRDDEGHTLLDVVGMAEPLTVSRAYAHLFRQM